MPAEPSRDRGTELQHPASHRFIGDVEPTLASQFLDIAVAQREAEIQPDRVLDDLSWEAMAAVAERSRADPTLFATRDPVSVTMQYPRLGRTKERANFGVLHFLAQIRLDHAMIVADGLGRALGDLFAMVEHGNDIAARHDKLHDMLDQDDG